MGQIATAKKIVRGTKTRCKVKKKTLWEKIVQGPYSKHILWLGNIKQILGYKVSFDQND